MGWVVPLEFSCQISFLYVDKLPFANFSVIPSINFQLLHIVKETRKAAAFQTNKVHFKSSSLQDSAVMGD